MNKESAASFIAQVINDLEKILDPKEYSVSLSRVEKLTVSYDSVLIFKNRENWGFNVSQEWITDLRDKEGLDSAEIAERIAAHAQKQSFRISADSFARYDEIRSSLFIRLSDTVRNKAVLDHVPHQDLDGLSVTCHILVPAKGCFASSIVTDELFNSYGISKDQLFADAIENSAAILPAEIYSLDETVGCDHLPFSSKGLIVTNSKWVNGASAILYPGILDSLCERIKEDFYVFPSSIHEMLVFPKSVVGTAGNGYQILHDANRNTVSEEEWLSDTLFLYSLQERKMHPVNIEE